MWTDVIYKNKPAAHAKKTTSDNSCSQSSSADRAATYQQPFKSVERLKQLRRERAEKGEKEHGVLNVYRAEGGDILIFMSSHHNFV